MASIWWTLNSKFGEADIACAGYCLLKPSKLPEAFLFLYFGVQNREEYFGAVTLSESSCARRRPTGQACDSKLHNIVVGRLRERDTKDWPS